MKEISTHIEFNVPTFKAEVHVHFHNTTERLTEVDNQIMSDVNGSDGDDVFTKAGRSYRAYVGSNGAITLHILIDISQCTLATLVHEIHHSVNYLMEFVGVEFSSDSEEVFACLNEYFFNSTYTKLPKKVRKALRSNLYEHRGRVNRSYIASIVANGIETEKPKSFDVDKEE